MRHWLAILALVAACLSANPGVACGPDTDCKIGNRHYRIRMPAGHGGKVPIGAIVFAHGYTGTARQVMRSKGFAAMARKMNVALIATKSAGKGWTLPGSPIHGKVKGADELAYYERVLDDAARRFPIDRKRMLATGFSAGGMMVWNLACHRSQLFAGYAPIAGTFWAPIPDTCTTPATSIIHLHGNADKTVPLRGRRIGSSRQGGVRQALNMYAGYGAFGPATVDKQQGLNCRSRRNALGHLLTFCLYDGGHSFYIRHIRQAWNMLVNAGRL
jgi:polyhydroxybutyrate depolymerase